MEAAIHLLDAQSDYPGQMGLASWVTLGKWLAISFPGVSSFHVRWEVVVKGESQAHSNTAFL